MKRLWGFVVLTVGGAFLIVFLLATALAFVPILALFAWFWWACPMTWESEFDHEAKRLLKGARE